MAEQSLEGLAAEPEVSARTVRRYSRRFLIGGLLLAIGGYANCRAVVAQEDDSDWRRFRGDWSLQLESKTPGWMSIQDGDNGPVVRMRLYVGSDGPHEDVQFRNGELHFVFRQNRRAKNARRVVVRATSEGLSGSLRTDFPDGRTERDQFTAIRIPPVPSEPPDLSGVQFGDAVVLFNGKDLTGWCPHEPEKKNGWAAIDGLLVNTTPKTDFSATGSYANLRTTDVFRDFRLHIEFQVDSNRNSGIYLRGMYEAQVVDRDSRMQGIQGPGAVFGLIAPSKNAGRAGGEWQSYDLTLVNRHVTVVLNGERVIDNQPLAGPTAGAILTNPMQPGPIYLQGDHTSVRYRNITLEPVISAD